MILQDFARMNQIRIDKGIKKGKRNEMRDPGDGSMVPNTGDPDPVCGSRYKFPYKGFKTREEKAWPVGEFKSKRPPKGPRFECTDDIKPELKVKPVIVGPGTGDGSFFGRFESFRLYDHGKEIECGCSCDIHSGRKPTGGGPAEEKGI